MLLFRSEEHVDRWCRTWGLPRGGLFSLDRGWALAKAWFEENRGDPQWRRKTPGEISALFESLDLVGDFWQLEG